MKCFNIKLFVSMILILIFTSCSEEKQSISKNSTNNKLIDSLAIVKGEKSTEINQLKAELDSLKKMRDSLKEGVE